LAETKNCSPPSATIPCFHEQEEIDSLSVGVLNERGSLRYAPKIKMLPEGKARTGFLEIENYDKLYAALGVEVTNKAKGTVSRPYAYVQPFLQIGFYTGMRLGEIKI
jgi:hypothetical protein